jgi:hypothetical protein
MDEPAAHEGTGRNDLEALIPRIVERGTGKRVGHPVSSAGLRHTRMQQIEGPGIGARVRQLGVPTVKTDDESVFAWAVLDDHGRPLPE